MPEGAVMKKTRKIMIVLGLMLLLVSACAPFAGQGAEVQTAVVTDAPDVNTIVALTFAAMTKQAIAPPSATVGEAPGTSTPTPTITVTPTPVPGSVSGRLSYPSEFIPAMRVVAFSVDGFNYRYVDTMQNQGTYQITGLLPGMYHIVAYVIGGAPAGGYTQMVLCGLSVDCTDHSLIDVTVEAGKDTPDINPGDWYAPEGTFPAMP
jgi:predicted small secreted protein